MENNGRKKIKFGSSELSDDDLGQVAGGTMMNQIFYIAKCPVCGWQSVPFDDIGGDSDAIVQMHQNERPGCEGELGAYEFDSKGVNINCPG